MMPCTVFFPTRKKYPKDASNSPLARHLKQTSFLRLPEMDLRSNYMRERRKSKEKISGSGATVRGKWPYYGVMNFLEYYLQCRTMEMFQRQ